MDEGNDQNKKKPKLNPDGDSDDMSVDDPLVSIVRQPQTPADEEILAALYPIILNAEPDDRTSTASLIAKLKEKSFFQVNDLVNYEEGPGVIKESLWKIYCDAREREINAKVHVQTSENNKPIPQEFLTTVFELRNAILHSKLTDVEESDGMEVYDRYVPDLQNPGNLRSVILRRADKVFWDTSLTWSKKNHPVCGVGNPGIGKTTTTLYLLQQIIMREKKPVVYTIRSESVGEGIYYELEPVLEEGSCRVLDIKVILHNRSHENMLKARTSLQNKDAFYVVDPGDFKGSCNERKGILQARFIMAASNDSAHWGKNDFKKDRQSASFFPFQTIQPNELRGVFVYGHLWTASQVLAAKRFFPPFQKFDEKQILQLYRMFGGSVRDIMSLTEEEFQADAQGALTGISESIISELKDGRYKFAFEPEQPSSIIIGIGPKKDKPTNLFTVFLKSDYIQELIAEKWLLNSWYHLCDEDNGSNRGNLFEAFVRRKFYTQRVPFGSDQVRESRREKPQTNVKRNYQAVTAGMMVGARRKVLRVSNLAASVRDDTTKEFVYYSKDEREPLIDMIYRVDGGYEAIQATISKKHDAARDKIENLKNDLDLQSDQTLRIFYAVPSVRYNEFATNPANPLDTDAYDFSNISIYHLSIDGVREEP